jgi:hypothetical protein
MIKFLIILVLFGLVVLLWPAISTGLGAIGPWVFWGIIIICFLLGLSELGNKTKK